MTDTRPGELLWAAAVNATLRVLTMASKLLLVVYLGRYLSLSDMAIYGLLTTSVGLAVTVLGLEFYAFTTREILAVSPDRRAAMLRDQLVFYLTGYALLFPLALPLFIYGVLPWPLAAGFYVLSILEHLGQEAARLFNTLFRPVLSTALFFIRSALWGFLVMAVGLLRPDWNTLGFVVSAWIGGVALSVGLAVRELRRMHWTDAPLGPVNWEWIRQGLVIAAPFMVSALSYRVTEVADRYIIHFLMTDAAVGVYAFYGMLANVIPAVVGAGVTSVLTPRIIDAHQSGRPEQYRRYFRLMTVSAAGISLAAVPVFFLAIAWVQQFTGKPEYGAELATCAVLLLSTATAVIAQLPGVALYARRDDKALLVAVVIGAVTNTVLNFLMIPRLGILGAAWATTIAYAAMGAYQLDRVLRARKAYTP